MKTSLIATAALAIVLVSTGCMEDAGRSTSTTTGTSIEALHPAALGGQLMGSVDSGCSSMCNMLDACELLSDTTIEQCIEACNLGYFDAYKDCILATGGDCYEMQWCFG